MKNAHRILPELKIYFIFEAKAVGFSEPNGFFDLGFLISDLGFEETKTYFTLNLRRTNDEFNIFTIDTRQSKFPKFAVGTSRVRTRQLV